MNIANVMVLLAGVAVILIVMNTLLGGDEKGDKEEKPSPKGVKPTATKDVSATDTKSESKTESPKYFGK